MSRPLRYADAVRLLGGSGPVAAALEGAVGEALTITAGPVPGLVLGLFGAESQIISLSRSLVSGLGERLSGLGRFGRTERLAAAHAVIVVAAYGEALAETPFPFDVGQLTVGRLDAVRLATGDAPLDRRLVDVADHLLRTGVPLPAPHQPYESTLLALRDFYHAASRRMSAFVAGCAVWDTLNAADRQRTQDLFEGQVLDRALVRYEELYRQLAAQFTELTFWTDRTDHRATRESVRSLTDIVTRLAEGGVPPARLAGLGHAGAAALDAPVLGVEEGADGMAIPTLREAYLSPDFRIREFTTGDDLTVEEEWAARDVRPGLDAFLADFLTAPQAVAAPVLLLGQPGAGKSLLTKVLAASLPAADFLVVRVTLRAVPADADIQRQIETAVRQSTGERLDWPDLVRAAGNALPVVLLDGFDELLQATGLNQSDYMERVADFQRREVGCGRPLAVLVTSRTAVADRARLTPDGVAIRIEPFTPRQTTQWLQIWNGRNAAYFADRGLLPLTPHHALVQPDLASQPLLLLLLALYDAEDNAFQGQTHHHLASYELYERLLARFARREVIKHGPSLSEQAIAKAVELELLRLSVAALAMANRGRQWVTGDELDTDLKALLPEESLPAADAGLRAGLSRGQVTVGRFFFVHRTEALRDAETLHSYEFLHATFGEYLAARLIVSELTALAESERAQAGRVRKPALDDTFLHALLSFSALCTGRYLLGFLEQGLHDRAGHVADETLSLLLSLFREAMQERIADVYTDYRPAPRTIPARHALYAANLLLLVHALDRHVTGCDLFPDARDPVAAWRGIALLFKSQMLPSEWTAFAGLVDVRRVWQGERREIQVRRLDPADDERPLTDCADPVTRTPPSAPDVYWSQGWGPSHRYRDFCGWRHRDHSRLVHDADLLCDEDTDALLNFARGLVDAGDGVLLTSFAGVKSGRARSAAQVLVELWETGESFSACHSEALWICLHSLSPRSPGTRHRYLDVVGQQWRRAGRPLDPHWLETAHSVIEADGRTARPRHDHEAMTLLYEQALQ
ncbi:NACHT domain-containing protein [Streptomyces fildesensis]|uniref:NACHT domain-containing protein n=1 Tax=Streptomyces fildesensis TaxID=375757 RepID=UPI003F682FF8